MTLIKETVISVISLISKTKTFGKQRNINKAKRATSITMAIEAKKLRVKEQLKMLGNEDLVLPISS